MYIGLATTCHDPAIAVVDSDGEVVFAEATERSLQSKRAWNCVPDNIHTVEHILRDHCAAASEIVIATSWSAGSDRSFRHQSTQLAPYTRRLLAPSFFAKMDNIISGQLASLQHAGANLSLRIAQRRPDAKVTHRRYDHHLTHAAAGCFSSAFDEATCVVVDGYGEGSSTSVFEFSDGVLHEVRTVKRSTHPAASLGLFYSELCEACGWDPSKGEEWKVMGLAAHGQLDEDAQELMRSILAVRDGRFITGDGQRQAYERLAEFGRPPGESPLEAADLAHTGQRFFCEIMEQLLGELHRICPSENLVLAGGCALNSACNGTIIERTPFKKLHAFSAPGDDGNAVGAALAAFYEDNPSTEAHSEVILPYLGSEMSQETLDRVVASGQLHSELLSGRALTEATAVLLAKGKIVGWIQGRAEFGPRALGSRSILADPRSVEARDRLNSEVKFRETFRPYAPSILHKHGDEYFESYQESPFMERALRFKREVVNSIPAVIHVDGTGRLQTVKREWNRPFYDVIDHFKTLTGIPLVLNTSYNVMGRPMVHTVEDALALYLTTGIDALAIGDRLFTKQ